MIIITDTGVKYFSQKRQAWTLATHGRDIPQEDYDAMPPFERYSVLAALASEGDGPVRF